MLISRGTRRVWSAVVALAAVGAFLTPGTGVAAAGVDSVGTPVIGFDAVGTQAERRGWKHLGLRRDRYVIFNDGGSFEQGFIRNKWPFLPARFTTEADAVSIVFVGSRRKYVFVKGTELVSFFDSGIVAGPMPYTSLWPFLGAGLNNGLDSLTEHTEFGVNVHLVTSGESFMIFNDNSFIYAQGLIRQRWPFLAAQLQTNLDDASIERENNGWKISYPGSASPGGEDTRGGDGG